MSKRQQKILKSIKRSAKKPKLTAAEFLKMRRNQWQLASEVTTGKDKEFSEGMTQLFDVFTKATRKKRA